MSKSRADLIAGLTEELEPVRQIRSSDGAAWVGLAIAASVVTIAVVEGLWHGLMDGGASPFFFITNGLLLLLGLSSASAVIARSIPRVGNRSDAPRWASAMLGVLPLAAIASLLSGQHHTHEVTELAGLYCLSASLVTSLITGTALVLWLRRGAPVSLNTAGWLTGLAAGALGTAAYGLSCPKDTVLHLGIWHVLPVAVAAVIGRLAVPHLIRW